jgi:hypothetical protein
MDCEQGGMALLCVSWDALVTWTSEVFAQMPPGRSVCQALGSQSPFGQ